MKKPVVFFDMDGVLADFVGGALRQHGKELNRDEAKWDFCTQIGFDGVNDPKFWAPLGWEFWANLDPLPDGFCLLRSVERMVGAENVALLSSPCETAGCADGKREWVKTHLPGYDKRLFLGSAKHLFAGPDKVLIDDHDKNVEAFAAAGGYALMVPRPWNWMSASCHPDGFFDVAELVASFKGIVGSLPAATGSR